MREPACITSLVSPRGGFVVVGWRRVSQFHASCYDANFVAWSRARDVIAGEDVVKAAGERYLPRLDSQTDDEYAAYTRRASFFNATSRTAGSGRRR